MKKEKQIDRSHQSDADVIMSDVGKSGFNLTYNNYFGGMALGRLYPIVYQWLMPSDKFSGSNQHMLTFEQLQTPVLSDVNVSMHNFYGTIRSVDKNFPKLMTPTKLNGMSSEYRTPRFNVPAVFMNILVEYFQPSTGLTPVTFSGKKALQLSDFIYTGSRIPNIVASLDLSYAGDTIIDLDKVLATWISSSKSATSYDESRSAYVGYCLAITDFFVGQGSILDFLGYPILSHQVMTPIFSSLYDYMSNLSVSDIKPFDSRYLKSRVFDRLDSTLLVNEYQLRFLYSIWVEYYRNFDVEPLTNQMMDYHEFGMSSLLQPVDPFSVTSDHVAAEQSVQLLVTRARCWSVDMFTAGGVDDISRHVFAPILTGNSKYITQTVESPMGNSEAFGQSWDGLDISYVDSVDGTTKSVTVPLPSFLLADITRQTTNDAIGLELNALRKARMCENYLKRMYYGGDEYRDRMLSIYGARIEDYRINRPELISSSFDQVAVRQEVANSGAAPGSGSDGVPQGNRLATATASTEGSDGFTNYTPEFGMYIGILSVLPRAQYDPLCPQLLCGKFTDFPAPQFANSMDENIIVAEISRSGRGQALTDPFAYAPYAHGWRGRVDSVHGQYLDQKAEYSFARFFGTDADNRPKLNSYFLHCHPNVDMFVDNILLDGQFYGVGKHNFLVERTLPVPVETI